MNFREETRTFRENHDGIEEALSAYVNRRWPSKTIKHVSHEWDLTEGLARGVVYGQATRRAINQILKHKRGGWPLVIQVMAGVIGHDLHHHIEMERAREREAWKRLDSRLEEMGRNLSLRRSRAADVAA